MRYTQEKGPIRYIGEIAPGVYTCMLYVPKIASAAAIGQFVGVLCEGMSCAVRFPCAASTPVWVCCGWCLRCGAREPWLSAGRRGKSWI